MEAVLSQNEVNALISAVAQGGVDEGDGASLDDARGYDLTSNDRIVRGRMPTLDILNQRLARLMRISFFNMFRRTVDVHHDSTQLMKYSEFISSVSVPACLNVFRMPPLRNTCLVAVDSALMFGLVDYVFGGSGTWYRVEGRDYSSIELRLITQVVSMVLADLGNAWEPVIEVVPEYIRTEVNPQFAAIAAPTDVAINIRFEVELEATTKGLISLLIPYGVIEPIRPLLSSAIQTERNQEDNHWRTAIKNIIPTLSVEMHVKIGDAIVTVGELIELEAGDTIRLNMDIKDPLPCEIEGVWKTTGSPVVSRGCIAVELSDSVGATTLEKVKEKEGEK
ncbi:MAG: flagellar motor switch protein FliM [Myxococcales bacterium]|nr:flagellar motor switch protein FliM [Myxococcales bacterium]